MASTRAESYEYPGALPKVEHAGIRSDLARRDFTINAMAVSLKPETFGDLFDYFGGREDLDARRIVVLHNLSFIEDPTRILRAIRYESRYGLRMDEHTLNLARACCAMDLVGDLSSARLRDELVSLLDEEKVDFALRRAEELGVWPAIHGRLRVDEDTRGLVRRADLLREAHHLEAEAPRWRLRLVWLLCDLDPEEIAAWAVRMRMRSADARVLERALVVGRRLVDRVARGPSEAELYDLAAGEPLEAVLAAMTLDARASPPTGSRTSSTSRATCASTIGGDDLLELGFTSGPRMGEVLRSVLHLKLNGVVDGRDEELEAAARMRERCVNDSQPARPLPHHLAAAHRQPRAARAGARLGGLPARRPDGQGARAAHAEPDHAPRHVGHDHARRHATWAPAAASSSAGPSRCRSTRASSRTGSAAWPGWAPPGRSPTSPSPSSRSA